MSEAAQKIAKDLLKDFEFGSIQDINEISSRLKQLVLAAETDTNFEALFRVKLKKEPVKVPHLIVYVVTELQDIAKNSDEEAQARLVTSTLLTDLSESMLRRNVSGLTNSLEEVIVVNGIALPSALALSSLKTDFGDFCACVQADDKSHASLINAICLEISDVATLTDCAKENLRYGRVKEFNALQIEVEKHGDVDTVYRAFVDVALEQLEKGVKDGFSNAFYGAVLTQTESKLPMLNSDSIKDHVSPLIDALADTISSGAQSDNIEKLDNIKALKYELLIEHGAKETLENLSEEARERVDSMIDSMETKLRF